MSDAHRLSPLLSGDTDQTTCEMRRRGDRRLPRNATHLREASMRLSGLASPVSARGRGRTKRWRLKF